MGQASGMGSTLRSDVFLAFNRSRGLNPTKSAIAIGSVPRLTFFLWSCGVLGSDKSKDADWRNSEAMLRLAKRSSPDAHRFSSLVLDQPMRSDQFRCLDCGHESLEKADDGHLCPSCGKLWPVHGEVPLFLPGLKTVESGLSLSDSSWKEVCQATGLTVESSHLERLKAIFARNYHLPEFHLGAENNYYFQRVPGLEKFLPSASADLQTKAPRNDLPLRFRVERHLIPESLPTDITSTWNVRIVNEGNRPFGPDGPGAVRLSYRWLDHAGNPLKVDGRPTALPVALAAGRGLSVPLLLHSPRTQGLHLLEIGLVDERGRWTGSDGGPILIRCLAGWTLELPKHWVSTGKAPATYDYAEDHMLGVEFLKEELTGVSVPRLLEIGGCCNPMTDGFDGQISVCDIDAQTLQVGRLRYAHRKNMEFLACDAARLPFPSGSFDSVVLFATLHHFADPIGCLREFRRVLKPGGFVMMGTEPVGSYMAETVNSKLLKELESGINEQVFTAQEYQRMFLMAGLFATRVEMDRGALRAILRPQATGMTVSLVEDRFPQSFLLRQWVKLNLRWAKKKVGNQLAPWMGKRKAA